MISHPECDENGNKKILPYLDSYISFVSYHWWLFVFVDQARRDASLKSKVHWVVANALNKHTSTHHILIQKLCILSERKHSPFAYYILSSKNDATAKCFTTHVPHIKTFTVCGDSVRKLWAESICLWNDPPKEVSAVGFASEYNLRFFRLISMKSRYVNPSPS